MGRKKEEEKGRERVESVLQILRKQTPLTLKQEKFCNEACIKRFLKSKGGNVKKAAKHLRACLSWRKSIGADNVMADEFSSELAEGVAYVAGQDDQTRPVLVFRIKQEYTKFHSQKAYVRLVVFTLEVAISSMSGFVDQLVILFDASFFRSASAFLNLFMATMKILSEYYPERLHRTFVVDPPSLFPYLWKGVRPFVDQWSTTKIVFSLDYETSLEDEPFSFRYTSLRFDRHSATATQIPTTPTPAKFNFGFTSSRFSFTVAHLDSLKPWYLSRGECTNSSSIVGASPISTRSFSFASPADRSTNTAPSTPFPPRTPRPAFLPSPATWLFGRRKQHQLVDGEEERYPSFQMYLRFYRKPYDEMVYRSKMRPSLGGIASIVSPQIIRQQRSRQVRPQRFRKSSGGSLES